MPSLVAASGPLAGARFVVQAEAVVGRSPSCEIAVADSRASRRHAKLQVQAGKLHIADLGSRNGTFVNGERIDSARLLEAGDRVIVGATTFVVDPPLATEIADGPRPEPDETFAPEDLLPFAGNEGVLLQVASQLLSASSQGAVVRRLAEELTRALGADVVSALILQEGTLSPAAVQGSKEIAVPRALVRATLEGKQVARLGPAMAAPLALRGGEPLGILFAERTDEPFSREELSLLASLARLGAQAMTALRGRTDGGEEATLVGQSRPFRRALELARKVAYSELAACFVGERGSGKRGLAEFSIARGPRAVQPRVAVELRAANAEEQLFGAPGRGSAFARADGGTLLLCGLEALQRPLATRLLDALSRNLAPGPDGGELHFDVRLYSTSREPPSRLAARGVLPYEVANLLAGVEVEVPPLRERPGDLELLLAHFAELARRERGARPLVFPPETLAALLAYGFPANAHEVRGLVERLCVLDVDEVQVQHLPPEMRAGANPGDQSLGALVEAVEREAIGRAMARAGGKKVEAARLLGISRPTLDKKLGEYGLGTTRKRGITNPGADSDRDDGDPENTLS